MLFHPDAEKAFNKTAFDLISLMEIKDIEKTTTSKNYIGSVAERPKVDWSDKLVDKPYVTSSIDIMAKKLDIYEEYQGKKTGFNKTNYIEFENFLKKVYKVKSISQKISFKYLYETTFNWLVMVKKSGQAQTEFTIYLSSEIEGVLTSTKYRFEVLNLDIEKPFKLGNVTFEYFTESFFDSIKAQPEKDMKEIKERYKGRVFVSYELGKVEISRGEEIAYEHCCNAMNVLKLFSPTISIPNYRTDFDIDRRVRTNLQSELITGDFDSSDLCISLKKEAKTHDFNVSTIDYILKFAKNFEKLILIEEPNELQKLLINSLSMSSEAISNPNVHKRIVGLLTIWESLLLKDTSSPIMDSVSMYASKLLRRTVDERKAFISFFKEIYDIRSKAIHHAKEIELDMHRIAQFQRDTINLIEVLIHGSEKHSNKQTLLTEIDEIIHRAG